MPLMAEINPSPSLSYMSGYLTAKLCFCARKLLKQHLSWLMQLILDHGDPTTTSKDVAIKTLVPTTTTTIASTKTINNVEEEDSIKVGAKRVVFMAIVPSFALSFVLYVGLKQLNNGNPLPTHSSGSLPHNHGSQELIQQCFPTPQLGCWTPEPHTT